MSRFLAGTAACAVTVIALAACGSGSPGSPRETIDTFLRASASGDGAKACAQLSSRAQGEVVAGASCEDGVAAGARTYGSIIKQIRVGDLRVQGRFATGASILDGRPTATFRLSKASGRWLIVTERRLGATVPTASVGPSEARVAQVAGCLDGPFGTIDNGGRDGTGGAHVVLSVVSGGYPIAEVDVFASASAALAGYKAINAYDGGLDTKLASTSVVAYFAKLPAGKQRRIEACG
jgi:hypothetical protein